MQPMALEMAMSQGNFPLDMLLQGQMGGMNGLPFELPLAAGDGAQLPVNLDLLKLLSQQRKV